MTFEYRDYYGDHLTARPTAIAQQAGEPPLPTIGIQIENGTTLFVPASQVEEVVAGIRDAARQTTGQDDTEAAPVGRCTVMFQGGGRCEKRADHRPPGSDDPHTPEPAPAVGQPAEVHDTDSSVRNVIEHALTAYYQDSSAPSAVARAILAQHRSETLREAAETFRTEAAETFRTEAAETATAAQENYDPDMAREAKRLNVMAARLDRMAVEGER